MQQLELIRVFVDPLENLRLPYIVTGSIASTFYGEPRLTHDIDLVVHLQNQDIQKFIGSFDPQNFYCPPDTVIGIELRRRPYGHFNIIHHASGFKADFYTSSADQLHEWALKDRRRLEITKEFSLWVAPPEYLIIRKLEFYREGGSEKHLLDIRKMLPLVGEGLDHQFLAQEIARRNLSDASNKVPLKI